MAVYRNMIGICVMVCGEPQIEMHAGGPKCSHLENSEVQLDKRSHRQVHGYNTASIFKQ